MTIEGPARAEPTSTPDAAGTAPSGEALFDDETIFRAIYIKVRRVAAIVGDPASDPDDLVQEALARLLSGGGLDGIENPEAYLKRSIVNLATNERRSKSRHERRLRLVVGGQVDNETPRYPSDLSELLRLDPEDRLILYLSEVEGEAFADIGRLIGKKTSTVRGRASRARKQLSRRIQEDHGEDA